MAGLGWKGKLVTWCMALYTSATLAAETKPLSPRDIFPATPENVGHALRQRVYTEPKYIPPDRMYEVGLGFGVPYLIGLEGGLQLLKKWQFGAFYGILPPTGLVPNFPLPSFTQSINGVLDFRMDPVVATSFSIWGPFVRFFPSERTFYFQLTWGMLTSNHRTTSPLTEVSTGLLIPNAEIVADVTLTTTLPTFSIGYFFWRRFFFFNLSIGATFLLSSTSDVSLTAQLPVGIGTLSPTEEATLKANLDQGLANAVAQFRTQVGILPSLMFSTGIMF